LKNPDDVSLSFQKKNTDSNNKTKKQFNTNISDTINLLESLSDDID